MTTRESVRAFALVGDRYHNSDYIRTSLKKTLVEELGVHIDFSDEVALLSAETLARYQLPIIFRDGMRWPAPCSKDFRHVQGSITEGHPPVRPYRVEIVDKEHPITRGVSDFVVTDEQHYMNYDKESKYVLAMSVNDHGHVFKELGMRCQAAWA